MNHTKLFSIITLTCLVLLSGVSYAQVYRQSADEGELPPKFLLIQIATHQNKVKYLQDRNQTARLVELQKDLDTQRRKMIADYADNFNYCPVYYYIDTNAEKIKDMAYQGVVLDKFMRPLKNIAPLEGDTTHVILLFGRPSVSATDYATTNPKSSTNDPYDAYYASTSVGDRQRPVLLDYKYRYINKPLPNGANNKVVTPAKGRIYYRFISKNFDISYKANASGLNKKLEDFYEK